jgi:hypothetical protein
MTAVFNDVKFTDSDVVNLEGYDTDAFCQDGHKRTGANVPWLIHDHGIAVCVVFASCEQDALDEAADNDKLNRYLVTPEQFEEYGGEDKVFEQCALLGNAGEPFDIETLAIVQLPNPKMSFVALFNKWTAQAVVDQ